MFLTDVAVPIADAAVPATDLSVAIPDALLLSAVGMGVVFLVLLALMLVIQLMAAIGKKPEPVAQLASASAAPAPAAVFDKAPGSAGEINLFTVDDKTAALIMSIVADDLKTPLNELRFISIKEVGK